MTIILLAWAIFLTLLLFGEQGLNALTAGKEKVSGSLENRKQKKVTNKEEQAAMIEDGRLSSARKRAHEIRRAEIEAEMHTQGNGFTLTNCGNTECRECFPLDPGRYEPASGYKFASGYPLDPVSEYKEYERRLKAGKPRRLEQSSSRGDYFQPDYQKLKKDADHLKKEVTRYLEEFTVVSGAGDRVTQYEYETIVVDSRTYRRPSEVPSYAKFEIVDMPYPSNISYIYWTWPVYKHGEKYTKWYKQILL